MSLTERIDELRDDIASAKESFETHSDEAQSSIENVTYALEMDMDFDNHFGGDWDEVASTYDDMAQTVREQIGELTSVIDELEHAANRAREVYEAQEELGDDE